MADIGNEIDAIRAAKNGEEVRGTIADALEAMNTQAESAEQWATGGEGGTAAADNNAKYYAEQAAASAEDAETAADSGINALANEANTYSSTAEYVAGNYVIYNGGLYRFTVNHAAGEWDSSQVEQVRIGTIFSSTDATAKAANRVLTLTSDAVPIDFIRYVNKGIRYTDGAEISSSAYCSTNYIDIRAFSTITYSRMRVVNSSSSVEIGIAFYTDEKTYVSGIKGVGSQSTFSYADHTVPVPAGAAYVRCTMLRTRIGTENEQFHILGVSKLAVAQEMTDETLTAVNESVSGSGSVLISYDITTGFGINYANGNTLSSASLFGYTNYIDIRKYAKLTYKRINNESSSSMIGIAFYDASKTYVYGVSGIPGAENYGYVESTVAVPPGAIWARFSVLLDTATYGTFTVSGESVYGGQETYFELEPACPFVLDDGYGYINCTTGSLVSSSIYVPSDYIECGGFDLLRYMRYASTAAVETIGLAFYDASKQYIPRSGEPGIGGQTSFATVERTIPIPEDAVYVRFSYPTHSQMLSKSIGNFSLTLIKIGTLKDRLALTDGRTDPDVGLYPYKPRSEGAANVVKRCHQMANVEWTPLSDVIRMININGDIMKTKFLHGIKYRGIPYSITLERIHSVGVDVSVDTFMSAVENSNTRMYDGTSSDYSYYGAVCSALVSGALGLRMEPVTRDMPNFPWFDLISAVGDFNEYDLEIGDIFLEPNSHVAIVTGILSDVNGIIKWIEISEETLYGYITGGFARSQWFTPTRLFMRFSNYGLYRYRYIDDVEYYPSVHSQVLPEQKSIRNEARMCYSVFGDKSVTVVSNTPVNVRIASGAYAAGYNTLRVFKDGVVYQETEITEQTQVITVPRTETGAYRVYLVNTSDVENDGKPSNSSSWYVVGGTFTKVISGTTMELTYNTDSTVYGIKYTQPGVQMNQYVPCFPKTGSGTVTFEIPSNATSLSVVLGNKYGTARVSV